MLQQFREGAGRWAEHQTRSRQVARPERALSWRATGREHRRRRAWCGPDPRARSPGPRYRRRSAARLRPDQRKPRLRGSPESCAAWSRLGDWELFGNEDRMIFDRSLFRWRNWGSPFELLQLLWAADRFNVYPPISVFSGLAKAVESYFLADGKKRFDECLGLVGKRGGRNYFTEMTNRSRDANLCQQMETLKGIWKVTVEKAAAMVAAANPNSISEDTIKFRYSNSKKWKELRAVFSVAVKVHLICWSPEDRQKFLNTFPLESLPPRLKSEHPSYNPKDPHK